MKITDIEVFALGDPRPYADDGTVVQSLAFVRIHTDEGISGLSEIFAVPLGVAKAVLNGPDSLLGRQLIGRELAHPEQERARLYESRLFSNRRGWAIICIGAAEVALWDLYGKALNQPVWQVLGGSERSEYQTPIAQEKFDIVPYCSLIASRWDPDTVMRDHVEKAERLARLGYRAIKLEPLRSSPEVVVETTKRVRKAVGPGVTLAVDVGYAWNDVPTAAVVARRLAEHDVFFLETPFPVDAVEAYRQLALRSPIPIAMGEHAVTRYEFLQMMQNGGVQIVQPYMTTVGGISEAKRVVGDALSRGVAVIPGNWSTSVLATATLHLAAYSPITPYFEYVAAEIWWSPLRRALRDQAPPVTRGAFALPDRPGIGIDLSEDLIAHFRVG